MLISSRLFFPPLSFLERCLTSTGCLSLRPTSWSYCISRSRRHTRPQSSLTARAQQAVELAEALERELTAKARERVSLESANADLSSAAAEHEGKVQQALAAAELDAAARLAASEGRLDGCRRELAAARAASEEAGAAAEQVRRWAHGRLDDLDGALEDVGGVVEHAGSELAGLVLHVARVDQEVHVRADEAEPPRSLLVCIRIAMRGLDCRFLLLKIHGLFWHESEWNT